MDILEFIKEKKEELISRKKASKEQKIFNDKIKDFFEASYFMPIALRNQNESDRGKPKENKLVGQKPSLYSDDVEHAWIGYGWESLRMSSEKHELVVKNFTRGVTFVLKNKKNESLPLKKSELLDEQMGEEIMSWVSQKYNFKMMQTAHDIKITGNKEDVLSAIEAMSPVIEKERVNQEKLVQEQKQKKKSSKKFGFK